MTDAKDFPVVEATIALNLIYDIIERVRKDQGVELTPGTIGRYVAERTVRRGQLNARLGIEAGEPE